MRLCPGRIAAFVETVTRRTLRYLFTASQVPRTGIKNDFVSSKSARTTSNRTCASFSRHFPDGNASKTPNPSLGNQFTSPVKKDQRTERAKKREESKQVNSTLNSPSSVPETPSAKRSKGGGPESLLLASEHPGYKAAMHVHHLLLRTQCWMQRLWLA